MNSTKNKKSKTSSIKNLIKTKPCANCFSIRLDPSHVCVDGFEALLKRCRRYAEFVERRRFSNKLFDTIQLVFCFQITQHVLD